MIASQVQPNARAALEHYKQRDISKGQLQFPPSRRTDNKKLTSSGRQVQINRIGTYHEDYSVQSNSFESVSGGYSIPERTIRDQSDRPTGTSLSAAQACKNES
jgi:hypothetical protein